MLTSTGSLISSAAAALGIATSATISKSLADVNEELLPFEQKLAKSISDRLAARRSVHIRSPEDVNHQQLCDDQLAE